jgi:hypothetical protein
VEPIILFPFNLSYPAYLQRSDLPILTFCPNIFLLFSHESFTAKRNGTMAKINWVTAIEQHNSGFNIERMTTSSDGWKELGFIPSQSSGSNSYSELSFSFNDLNDTNAVTLYRLRQVDQYSKTK